MKKLICWIFGHCFGKVSKSGTAKSEYFISRCNRCGEIHEVSYDMSYGETVSLRKLTQV